jgi:predicted transcriptional regulator
VTRRQRGELERAVLEVLWDHGGWLTPAEVRDRLEADLAYTTVVTVLRRLFDKKLVAREVDGRAHAYRPHSNREEYAAEAMAQVLADVRDPVTALNHFVESLGEDDRRQLSRLLRRRQ